MSVLFCIFVIVVLPVLLVDNAKHCRQSMILVTWVSPRMVEDPRVAAQEEAQKHLKFLLIHPKDKLGIRIPAIALVKLWCLWYRSKSDPELYEEYKERMKEMGEEFKKKKYG